MPIAAKVICRCGRAIVPKGERCAKCQAKGKRNDQAYERRRGSFRDRGYTAQWTDLSSRYRQAHPLCVPCLARGIVKPSQCTDHIIPVECCPDLILEVDNLQGACMRCNSLKRFSDPKTPWTPNPNRIVACGLPGTGKTTWAKSTGHAVWDADDYPELTTIDAVQRARNAWIAALDANAPCVVIVASTLTAPHVALQLKGTVKHFTEQHVVRQPHPIWGNEQPRG